MGTRSFVGRRVDGDTIEVIYGQFDGYVEGVGKILNEHYNSREKLEEILKLGSFRSLGASLEYPGEEYYNRPTEEIDFTAYSRFYIRDLGADSNDFNLREEISLSEFMSDSGMIAYAYIWDDEHQDYEVYGYSEEKDSKFGFIGLLSSFFIKEEEDEDDLSYYEGSAQNYNLLKAIIIDEDIKIVWPDSKYNAYLKMLINGEERYYSSYTGIETMIMDLYLDPEIGQYLPDSTKKMCIRVLEKIAPEEVEVYQMLHDIEVDLDHLWSRVSEGDIGFADGINDREIIEMYISEQVSEGISVSHMLVALEENYDTDYFQVWLGNSMETPEPIRTKRELIEAIL